MNNFPSSAKFQDESDYPSRLTFNPRHPRRSPVRDLVNKHTSTPYEFMLCPRCHEKVFKKKKEEKYANYPIGDCDGGAAEYSKALNYINSCHTIINEMMRQANCNDYIQMPDLPNFVDLFNSLTCVQNLNTAKDTPKKSTHESRLNTQIFENSRSRSNSADKRKTSNSSSKEQISEGPSLKPATKGKFIELLPDVKQNKYKKHESFSPGTTESEESDIELKVNIHKPNRISMPNKFRSKIKPSNEKVIYEEDSVEDDFTNGYKKDKGDKNKQSSKEDSSSSTKAKLSPIDRSRPVQNLPPAVRNRALPPMIINPPVPENNAKKVKQRSASSVAPRERPKFGTAKKGMTSEIGGNFSDTVITAGNTASQHRKLAGKTLCTPIDMRNNELSQQDLDKYAKELLGSESPSPRSPRSKSPGSTGVRSSTLSTKSKNDQEDKNKRTPKFGPIPTLKSQAADQKRRSVNQEKLNSSSSPARGSSVSTTNIYQKQEQLINATLQQQARKYRKMYSNQHQPQLEPANQVKKGINCRKTSNSNCCAGNGISTNKSIYCFGTINQQSSSNESWYEQTSRNDMDKIPESRENNNLESNEDMDDDNNGINLLCDNTETLTMHSRSRENTSKSEPPIQYAVTTKPHDFFTTTRKSTNVRMIRNKHEIDYDIIEDSDEIKTDSDIDEDHFDKENEDESSARKSIKKIDSSEEIPHVLSHLGLLPNSQTTPETEQMMNEVASLRAQDERNVPFREPRKTGSDAANNEGSTQGDGNGSRTRAEAFPTDNSNQLHRTISEESSDIKSDDDMYNVETVTTSKSVAYNFCLNNARYT